MKLLRSSILFVFGGLFLAATVARAEIVTVDASNDTWIRDGFSHTTNGIDDVLDTRLSFVPYIQFDLSGLNIASINSATLSLRKVAGGRNDGWTADRFLLYGLTDLAGNTLQNWHETEDFDPNDGTDGLDFRNVGAEWTNQLGGLAIDTSRVFNLDQDSGANVVEAFDSGTSTITVSGDDLVSFLQQRVDANGLVTLMTPINVDNRGWGIASRENGVAAGPSLTLDITAVPEPGTIAVLGLASGCIAIRSRRRSKKSVCEKASANR